MNCFVTGASGFVGANLVHELVARGHRVKALIRPGSNTRGLDGVKFERVEGDVTADPQTLQAALRGCGWCFHAAAMYHLWLPDYRPMYAVNVAGTRNVIEAAGAAGCSRIVHTSTVGCVGVPLASNGTLVPSEESTPVRPEQMSNHYKRSKWQAEQLAVQYARKGFPVVIVNPTAPAGPRDVKPTPTGRLIVDFLRRRLPAYLDTGLNWVHVRDVAVGHILAAEKGRCGERYILGNSTGNWTMKQTFLMLEKVTGVPGPRLRISYLAALGTAWVQEGLARVTGKPPRAPLAGVRMARHKMFYDPAKAVRELGLPQTPPELAFREAAEWFRANGYLNGRD